jgi:hypothetical protein
MRGSVKDAVLRSLLIAFSKVVGWFVLHVAMSIKIVIESNGSKK